MTVLRRTYSNSVLYLVLILPLSAQTLYWDTNEGRSGATDEGYTRLAPGVWDVPNTANWNANPDGTWATQLWSQGGTAVFSAGSNANGYSEYTVSMGSGVDVSSIIMEEGYVKLYGGDYNGSMYNLGSLDIGSSASLRINVARYESNGPVDFVKTGLGTLIFNTAPINVHTTGDYTFSGGYIFSYDLTGITSGDVTVNNGSYLQTNGTLEVDNRTLTISGAGSRMTNADHVDIGDAGSATVNVLDGGVFTVSDFVALGLVNGRTGTVTVDGAGSTLSSGTNLFVGYGGTGNLTISNHGRLAVGQTLTLGYQSTGAGTITLASGGTLAVGGTNGIAKGAGSASITLSGGTIENTGSNLSTSVPLTLTSGTTSTIATYGLSTELSGALSGTGGLAKSGTGDLTLSSLTSGHTFESLVFGGGTTYLNGAAPTIGTAIFNGGTFANGSVDNASAYEVQTGSLSAALGGSAALTKTGTGTFSLTGINTYTGGTTVTAGRLVINSDANLGASNTPLTIYGDAIVDSSGHDFITNRRITADGTWAQLYTDSNLIIGNSTISWLTLANGASASAYNAYFGYGYGGLGVVNISSGSTLSVSNATTLGAYFGSSGSLTVETGGTFATGGLLQGEGFAAFNLAGGSLRSNGSYSTSVPATLTNAPTVDTNGYATTLIGVLSGSGSLTKAGNGTLTLGSSNTYTGGTTVNAGTLALGNANALGSTSANLYLNGGNLDLGTYNPTVGTTVLNGGSFSNGTLNNASAFEVQSGSLAASLGGSAALTKTGAGTFTLSGSNTYSGGTAINAGTLTLGHATNTLPDAGAISISGGTLALGSNSDTVGAVTLSSGSITGSGTLTGASYNLTDSGTLSANLGGNATLTKSGAGNAVLSGHNSYTGGTIVNAGTLTLGHATDTLANAGSVTVSGGTLALGTNSDTVGAITLSSGSITGSGLLAGSSFNLTNTGTLSANLTGSASLTKSGAGNATLSGFNTYTGGTTVDAGTLTLGHTHALGSSSANLTLNGGTLDLGSNTPTVGTAIFNGGTFTNGNLDQAAAFEVRTGSLAANLGGTAGLTKTGAGTFTLSGTNTYSGGTTVSAGTLAVGSAAPLGSGNLTVNGGTLAGSVNLGLDQAVTVDSADAALTAVGYFEFGVSGTGSLTVSDGAHATSGTSTAFGVLADSTGTGSVTGSDSRLDVNQILYLGYRGTGTLSVADGGTVTSNSISFSGDGGTGTLNLNDGGTLETGDINTGSSADFLNLAGGILKITGSAFDTSIATTLAASTTSTINTNGNDAALSGGLSGSGALTKSGTGNLTLSGTNTYSGGTTVSAGTLTGNTASLQGNITDNAAVAFDQAATGTYAGVISGTGSLTKTGAGALTLSGANTYAGATTVNAGALTVGSHANLGTGDLTVSNGATLNVTGGYEDITNRTINVTGAGSTLAGDAHLWFNRAADTTNTINVTNGGTITAGTSISLADLGSTSVGTLNVSGTDSTVSSAQVFYVGYRGQGTANISNGGVVAAGGNLELGSLAGGDGTINLNSGGTLRVGGTNGILVGAGTGHLNGNGGTLEVTGSSLTTVVPLTLAAETASAVNTNGLSATLAGVLSGTGALTKSGAGTLTLSGTNTYSGGTTVSAGTLTGNATSLQGDITNNAAVVFDQAATGTYANAMSGTGSLTKSGAGALTLSGTNTYSGGTTLAGGTLNVTSNANLGASSGAVTAMAGTTLNTGGYFSANRTITLDGAGTHLYNNGEFLLGNAATGSVTLTNSAAAFLYNLTLGYDGGTGTLDIGSGSTVTASHATSLGSAGGSGTLNLNTGGTLVTPTLSGSGTFNFAGGSLRSAGALTTSLPATLSNASTVDTNGYATTLAGVLSGNGSLTKSGAGNLTLSGTNTYSGGTTVSAGTLFGDSNSLQGNIANNAAVVFDQTATGTYADAMSGTGSLTKSGAGALTLSGTNTYSGGTTLAGGTLNVTSNANLGASSGAVTATAGTTLNTGGYFSANRTITLDGAGTHLYNNGEFLLGNAATGSVALTNNATASLYNLTLGYDGGTGTLDIASGSTVTAGGFTALASPSSTLNLNPGGTLITPALSGSGIFNFAGGTLRTGGDLTTSLPASLSNASTVDTNGHNATLSGVLSGAGSLAKIGAGSLTLAGPNTYSGDTTISAGTLVLSDTTSSPSFALANGATLELNVASGTRDHAVSTSYNGAGTLAKTGNGSVQWGASAATFALDSGARIDVQAGTFTAGSGGNDVWTNNRADLNVAAGATFAGVESNVRVDALTGAGTITSGYNGGSYTAFTFGVDDGSGTFSGVLADTDSTNVGNFVKAGAGTQILTGANTSTGTTTITGGTLQIGDGGNSGSLASGSIVNNATLAFDRTDATAVSAAISGTGALTQSGSGNLTLAGTNSYSGGTTVSAGTLTGNSASLQGNIANHAALTFDQAATGTYAGNLSGTGSLTKTGSGNLTLAGANTYSGGTTVSVGTLTVSSDAKLGASSGTLAITSGATLDTGGDFRTNRAVTLDGAGTQLANNGELIIGNGGTGSLALTNHAAAATYNLTLGYEAGGNGTLSISSDSTVTVGHATTLVSAGGTSATLNLNTGGTLITPTLSGNGTFNLAGGTLRASGALTSSVNAALTNASTVDTNGHASTLSGVLSGTGSLAKTGSGSLTLAGANTYAGDTTVAAGTLVLSDTTSSPSFALANGATLELNVASGTRDHTASTAYTGAGTLTKTGDGSVQWGNSAATFALDSGARIDVQAGTFTAGSGGNDVWTNNRADLHVASGATFAGVESNVRVDALTGAGTITSGYNGGSYSAFTFGVDDGSGTFSGVLADTDTGGGHIANFTKAGSGTQILTGTNTSTGTTTISDGTLQIGDGGNSGSLASGSIVNNATLAFDRTDATSVSAAISGSGALIQSGSGNVTLAGTNSYSGGTTVSAGTLTGNSASLQGNIANHAALTFDQAATGTYAGTLSGTGSFTKTGSGTLTLSAANSYSGGTTVSSGTLVLSDTTASPSFAITSGSTLELNVDSGSRDHSASTTYTGAGTLTKTGSGSVQWGTSVGTFALDSGALIDVQAGKFTAGSSGNDHWTNNRADLHVAAGATFAGVESNVRVDALTGAGTITSGYNGSGYNAFTFGVDGGSGTFSGVLADSDTAGGHLGNYVKAGSGTQTLSGANTYSGTTTVSAGTLTLGSASALGSTASVSVTDGATLNLNSHSVTLAKLDSAGTGSIALGSAALTTGDAASHALSGAISGTGSLSKVGSGALTLNGANTYTGATTINGGTLALGANGTIANSSGLHLGSGGILDLTAKTAGFTFGQHQTLSGSGTINLAANQTLTLAGTVAPGNSPGLLSINGDASFSSTALISLEIAGAGGVAGTDFDQINVSGNLNFGGTLNVSLANDYTPTAGSSFAVFQAGSISGTFSQLNLPALSGLTWNTDNFYTTGTLSVANLSAVPEPSTYALFAGLAILGFAARRRRG